MPMVGYTSSPIRKFLSVAIGEEDSVETNTNPKPYFGVVRMVGKGFNGEPVAVEISVMSSVLEGWIAEWQRELDRVRSKKVGDRVKLEWQSDSTAGEVLKVLEDGECMIEWPSGYHSIIHSDKLRKVA